MDVTVWSGYFLKVVVFFIPVVLRQTEGQVYNWIGSSTLTPTILPCSNASTQLEFNWTYTPETPVPALIEWTIRNSGGGFDNIATLAGGSLTINPTYSSRFIRIGTTAEFALKNPTSSDVGFYRVSVSDLGGGSIDGEAYTAEKYISVSTISAECSVNRGIFTMTCFGTDEPDVPASCIELRKTGVLFPGTAKDGTLNVIQEDIDNEKITCHLCGVISQCLPEPSIFICPDCQPCKNSARVFLVISLSSIGLGFVAIFVVKFIWSSDTYSPTFSTTQRKMPKGKCLRLALCIVGGVWIGLGLIGFITVPAICSQVKHGEVFPCGSMTIASFVFNIITCVAGVVIIFLVCYIVPGVNVPDVNVPGVNVPDVNIPDVNDPYVNVPDENDPYVNVPDEKPREENQYDFNHKSRGVALILCDNYQGHSNNAGADPDVRHFEQTFAKLGFSRDHIRVCYYRTVGEMLDLILKVSNEDHTDNDCLIVAISSHGDEYTYIESEQSNVTKREDVIYGTDKVVFPRDLVDKFRDEICPSLAGKPRIFFIQACPDTNLAEEVEIEKQMDVVDALTKPQYTVSPTPFFKDFCIVYATPPGHFASCRPSEGSWFVKGLWDVVSKSDIAKTNFHELIQMVIRKVALDYQSSSDAKKQSGYICSNLTKDVYFTDKKKEEQMVVGNTPPISPHPQEEPQRTTDVTNKEGQA